VCQRGQHLIVSWTERIVDRVIGWSTVAVVVTVTVLFLTLVPMLGTAGSWVAAIAGAGVLAVSVWQIARATRSSEQVDGQRRSETTPTT
jgi:FtsH-binding integral membrane protein